MMTKKLNHILFPIVLISFVTISSCKNEVKEDTLSNWASVTVTFPATASSEARLAYLNNLKEDISNYVRSKADSTRGQIFTARFNEETKDSIKTSINISVNRTYWLKDSISNPRPRPCPPTGLTLEEAFDLDWDCPIQ